MTTNAAEDSYFFTFEVTRVTFQKPDSDWVCVKGRLDDTQPESAGDLPRWMREVRDFAVTGYFKPVQVGDLLDMEGTPTRHKRFGWQIAATRVQVCARQDQRALFAFLRRLPHVGPQRATLIIDHFGGVDAVFSVLDNEPTRLAEITGITPERAEEAAAQYAAMHGMRDAWLLCRELKLQSRLTTLIMERLKGKAREIIEADPFLLMTEINASFRDCDVIRERLGIAKDDPRRLAAAMLVVLRAAGRGGDCYAEETHLFGAGVEYYVDKARTQVGVGDDLLRQGLEVLQQPSKAGNVTIEPRVVAVDGRYYLAEVYEAEHAICRGITGMLAA